VPGGFAGAHGSYVPEGTGWNIGWTTVDGDSRLCGGGDHHRVWLFVVLPGRTVRTRVLLGEVRRYGGVDGSHPERRWRAFPEGILTEFPPVFKNHYEAMLYLKNCWEARVLVEPARPPRPRPVQPGESREEVPSWVKFFGEDPWDDLPED
jgi:hypothetical protein